MPKEIKDRMIVADLIQKLQEFPQDLPVALDYDLFDGISVRKRIWIDTNNPDGKDIEFVSLR